MIKNVFFNLIVTSILAGQSVTVLCSETNVDTNSLIESVVSSNLDVRLNQTSETVYEAKSESAKAVFYPKITGSVSQSDQDESANDLSESVTAKIGASLNIYNGSRDINRLRQSKVESEIATKETAAKIVTIRERASKIVFQIVSLQYDIKNVKDKIKAEQERERDLARRYDARAIRKTDLLAVRASLKASQADLTKGNADLVTAWNDLTDLAGRNLVISDVGVKDADLTPIKLDLEDDFSPDVVASRFDLESSKLALENAKGRQLPVIELGSNYYFKRPKPQEKNNWDLSLTATIAIPGDPSIRSAIKEAAANVRLKEQIRDQKELTSKNRFNKVREQYENSLKQLTELSAAVSAQEELTKAWKKDHLSGLASIYDYLNSVTSLLQRKQARDRLFVETLQLKYELTNKYSVGRGK
jgi:outer membrane protein